MSCDIPGRLHRSVLSHWDALLVVRSTLKKEWSVQQMPNNLRRKLTIVVQ